MPPTHAPTSGTSENKPTKMPMEIAYGMPMMLMPNAQSVPRIMASRH